MAKSILSLCIIMFLAEDVNDGIMEYDNFKKVGLNNRVSLSHSSFLQRTHQWAHVCMKKSLGVSLAGTFVPHVQEQAISSESDVCDSIEVHG